MQQNRPKKHPQFNHNILHNPSKHPNNLNQTDNILKNNNKNKDTLLQTHVYKLTNNIYEYEAMNGPKMSQDKREMIEEKLQLEKEAKQIALVREMEKKQMINYNYNPFAPDKSSHHKQSTNSHQEKRKFYPRDMAKTISEAHDRLENQKNYGNIVEAVNDLKKRDLSKSIGKIRRQKCEFVDKVSKQVWNGLEPPKQRKSQRAVFEDQRWKEEEIGLTFDDIVAMPDENYYEKNQVKINLFQFAYGNHEPFLSSDILDRYYFSHHSIVEKSRIIKIPMLRQISRIARKYVKDYKFTAPGRMENLTSNEVTFKIQDILFVDILGAASGRLSPSMAYKMANQLEMRDGERTALSTISVDTIAYEDHNNNHKATNHLSDDIQKSQIVQYQRLKNSKNDERYQIKSNHAFKITEELMKRKVDLTRFTIRDTNQHKEIKKSVEKQIDFLISMDYVKEPAERKVRKHKCMKNRTEQIKIKTLLRTIQLKNREENKIKLLIDGANK